MAALKFDLAEVARGVVAQLAIFDDTVAALTPADLATPTRLGSWTVGELVGHVASSNIASYFAGPSATTTSVDWLEWARGAAPSASKVDERARNASADGNPSEALHSMRLSLTESLATPDPAFVVPARFGNMPVAEYLATRCVELTVHTLDLVAAVGGEPALDRHALGPATRLLAAVLAANAPGRSVEVRIPPYAVVQCVEGPRHTRGTPPNVVETDAVTWLEIATGRLGWQDAERSARLSASGERADLSSWLPVLS
jgi:uncharacterized protein (TIGR03083 family)